MSVTGKLAIVTFSAATLMTSVAMQAAPSTQESDLGNRLLGTWRLVSFTQRLADGTTRQGRWSVGYLIYTDTGHMCAVGMDPGRPKWQSGRAPTGEEAQLALKGLEAYCSKVEINAADGYVIHRVEISGFPNFVGAARKRWFTFQGPDRLTLRVDPAELAPSTVETILIWERVENSVP